MKQFEVLCVIEKHGSVSLTVMAETKEAAAISILETLQKDFPKSRKRLTVTEIKKRVFNFAELGG